MKMTRTSGSRAASSCTSLSSHSDAAPPPPSREVMAVLAMSVPGSVLSPCPCCCLNRFVNNRHHQGISRRASRSEAVHCQRKPDRSARVERSSHPSRGENKTRKPGLSASSPGSVVLLRLSFPSRLHRRKHPTSTVFRDVPNEATWCARVFTWRASRRAADPANHEVARVERDSVSTIAGPWFHTMAASEQLAAAGRRVNAMDVDAMSTLETGAASHRPERRGGLRGQRTSLPRRRIASE